VTLIEARCNADRVLSTCMLIVLECNIKYGISSPIWFYFHPNGLVMKDSLKKH
jgi:hypothetical protein